MVGLEDTGIVINKVGLQERVGLGLDKAFTYGSHSKPPHHLITIQPLLTLQQVYLFFFIPLKSVNICYQSEIVDIV